MGYNVCYYAEYLFSYITDPEISKAIMIQNLGSVQIAVLTK